MTPLLIIVTRGRPQKQPVGRALIDAGYNPIFVGTEASDIPDIAKESLLYTGGKGLTGKRDFILDYFGRRTKMIVFDDDVSFMKLQPDGAYTRQEPLVLRELITTLWGLLDTYPLVGVIHRMVARLQPQPFVENVKPMAIIGTNFNLMDDPCPVFRAPLHQDTDMALQILTRGYKTAMVTNWCHDQTTYSKGGCSAYRTDKMLGEMAVLMETLWPGIVTVTDTGGHRVSWKKAKKMGGLQ